MVKKKFSKPVELFENRPEFVRQTVVKILQQVDSERKIYELIEFRFSKRAACSYCGSDWYFRRVAGELQNHGCLKFEKSHDVPIGMSQVFLRKMERFLL